MRGRADRAQLPAERAQAKPAAVRASRTIESGPDSLRLATHRPGTGLRVQRACACGGSGGRCTCEDETLLQRSNGEGAGGDRVEAEADRAAEQVSAGAPVESLSDASATTE